MLLQSGIRTYDKEHQGRNDENDVVPRPADGSFVAAVVAVLLVVAVVPVPVALLARGA